MLICMAKQEENTGWYLKDFSFTQHFVVNYLESAVNCWVVFCVVSRAAERECTVHAISQRRYAFNTLRQWIQCRVGQMSSLWAFQLTVKTSVLQCTKIVIHLNFRPTFDFIGSILICNCEYICTQIRKAWKSQIQCALCKLFIWFYAFVSMKFF